jgi:hypothetical protein
MATALHTHLRSKGIIPICYHSHREHRGRRDDTRERATVALVAPIPVDGWFDSTLVSHWHKYCQQNNAHCGRYKRFFHGKHWERGTFSGKSAKEHNNAGFFWTKATSMYLLIGSFGVILVLLVVVDVLQTTLLLRGSGPFTSRLNNLLWKIALHAHRVRPAHRLLGYVGLLIIIFTIFLWISLVWLGWVCIFTTEPTAVLSAQTNQPAALSDRVYFVGYTLITLGLGDYKAGGPIWQVATVIASTNGFFLVTLIITYLLPIVSAVVHQRQLATYITGLGTSPTQILICAWNGQDFGALSQHLTALTPDVLKLGQQHLAYPVLHYYHSREHYSAIAPNIATLDEALTVLEYGVEPVQQLDTLETHPLRMAITHFLNTLETAFITPDSDTPPLPDLMHAREQGIQIVSAEVFQQRIAHLTRRRQLLLALVKRDGWAWDDVHAMVATREDMR